MAQTENHTNRWAAQLFPKKIGLGSGHIESNATEYVNTDTIPQKPANGTDPIGRLFT